MSKSSSWPSNRCLCMVYSIYANPCSHREPIVLPVSVYLRSWYRLLWGTRKSDFISTNNYKDFFPPSDNNLKKWYKLPFPWYLRSQHCFTLISLGGEWGLHVYGITKVMIQTTKYWCILISRESRKTGFTLTRGHTIACKR